MPSPEVPANEMPAPVPAPEDAPMDNTSMQDPNMEMPPVDGAPEGPTPNEMGTENMGDVEGGDSAEIMNLFNSLNPDDQKAAKKYIESMADNNTNATDEPAGMEQPMAESVIFTKKQINEHFSSKH